MIDRRRSRRALAPLLAVLAALLAGVPAAVAREAATAQPATIEGATQVDFASTIAGETFRVSLWKPRAPPPPGGYPVFLVTDGGPNFGVAVLAAGSAGDGPLGPVVVVGVGYPPGGPLPAGLRRLRNLTPPTAPDKLPQGFPPRTPTGGPTFGGSDLFFRFLSEELGPWIRAQAPVNPQRFALFGHSVGGLFALEVLFKHPTAFQTVIAASPSIWWADKAVLLGEPGFEAAVRAGTAQPRVLITVGAREETLDEVALPPGRPREEMAALAVGMAQVKNARALGAQLAAVKGGPGYASRLVVFDDETHASVIPAAISRGLRFFLAPSPPPAGAAP